MPTYDDPVTATLQERAPQPPALSDEPSAPTCGERLCPPMPDDGWWGWVGPLAVTAARRGAAPRDLGRPHAIIVDETYYVKDALVLLQVRQRAGTITGADDEDPRRQPDDVFNGGPGYVVHPPFGKWVIASGEWLFGVTPVGLAAPGGPGRDARACSSWPGSSAG